MFLPKGVNFKGYKHAGELCQSCGPATVNTIAYVIMGTLVTIVVNIPASYALSRKHLYGRKFFTAFYLIPMFFTGGLIPTYLAVQRFHLLDTFWVMVVPFSVVTYYIIVGRTFFNKQYPGGSLGGGAAGWMWIPWILLQDCASAFQSRYRCYCPVGSSRTVETPTLMH